MIIASAVQAASRDMTGGEIIGMFTIAFFIVGAICSFIIYVAVRAARGDQAAKKALDLAGKQMSRQLKGYSKSFKDGYNDGKNRALGALALIVPAATADEMQQKFSDGLGQVLDGVWQIAAPYVAMGVVLFIIIVAAKKFAGRQR